MGALCAPGTTVLTPDRGHFPAGVCRFATARPCTPPHFPSMGVSLNEASTKGSRMFARPVFPSLWPPGWNGPPLGQHPGLRTPPTKSQTTHAEEGTGHRARTWNYPLNSHLSISNPVVLS